MRKIAVRKIVKIRRTLILLKRIVIANILFNIRYSPILDCNAL